VTTLPALLRQRDVLALLGVSRATLWSWREAGTFPKPIRLGPNVIAWTEASVRDWLAKRTAS
jgi:prophage regulatory protein